ncbi:hypothetical protein BDR06DRAFT_1015418 [Suillus hirtellus]|nr:hypothetical protein BDR06DRAFT_1015418 [Suillus hirtellus]
MTSIAGLMTWFGRTSAFTRACRPEASTVRRSLTTQISSHTQCSGEQFQRLPSVSYRMERLPQNIATFITNYILLITWPIMYFGARFYYGTKPVAPEEVTSLVVVATPAIIPGDHRLSSMSPLFLSRFQTAHKTSTSMSVDGGCACWAWALWAGRALWGIKFVLEAFYTDYVTGSDSERCSVFVKAMSYVTHENEEA